MGGSVIRLDIPRDTVSTDCNIKSARGHTSIHLTPWQSRAQYKRWNQESYKSHDRTGNLMDRFHAAERKVRSILQSRHLSLQRMAHTGWMHPAWQSGPYHEQPTGYCTYYSEEDALVYRDLQRTGLQEDMPEEYRAGPVDRSARPPNNPPMYEEALHSLGRAPTVADLGPHSPDSCSSSLVPYGAEEDSNPEEDQNWQEVTLDQMETEELATVEAPAKKGMGIAVGPGEYQPTPPRYVRADEDSEDNKDTDEDEDIEAPYLAPKQNPTPKTPQDEQIAPTLPKNKFASAKDSQVSSGNESIPELIDLREGEEVPPPSLSKKANHPTTLGLHVKIAVTSEKLLVFPFPPPKENAKTPLGAALGTYRGGT